jgi:hypothetical protein
VIEMRLKDFGIRDCLFFLLGTADVFNRESREALRQGEVECEK